MSSNQDVVFGVIQAERRYQNARWTSMQQAKIGEEVLLLDELVTQARAQWTKEKAPEVETMKIVRKIAAVAVRCMENHGAIPR